MCVLVYKKTLAFSYKDWKLRTDIAAQVVLRVTLIGFAKIYEITRSWRVAMTRNCAHAQAVLVFRCHIEQLEVFLCGISLYNNSLFAKFILINAQDSESHNNIEAEPRTFVRMSSLKFV